MNGYLPDPFLHEKFDSFMDWYNPAYWANNHGAYPLWRTIYPPFSFVFLRLFTKARCYAFSWEAARDCDPTGIVLVTVLMPVNFVLAWLVFRKIDRATAVPRAIAVSFGFPLLFAWERANLIVPCFTAFVLAHGNLLKSARLKALFAAITINFKPYLVLSLAGRFVKRDWAWLEWCVLCFIAIYAASFAIFGAGDPRDLFQNTIGFEHSADIDLILFATTYNALLTLGTLPLPIVALIGSGPIETAELVIPLLIYPGAVAVLACLAYATWRPTVFTRERISAFTFILFMSISTAPGGYSSEFALFFVFYEKWRGPSRILILFTAYLWCLPIDFPVFTIYHDIGYSYLSNRIVPYDLSVTVGEIVRPALMLLIEYGLLCTSVGDIVRDLRNLSRRGVTAAFS